MPSRGREGLRAAGETNAPAAKRGLDYLLSRQTPDGSWPEEATTGTGFPNVFYLTYGMYRDYFPMLALAGWLEALRPVPIFTVARPSRLPCRHSAGIREREFV